MNRRLLLLLLCAETVLTHVCCDQSLPHGGLRSHSGDVLRSEAAELPNALKARNDVDGRKLSKSGKSHKAKKAKTKPPTLSPTNTVVSTGSPTLTDAIEDPETPTQSPTQSPTEDGTVEKPGNPTSNPTPTKRPPPSSMSPSLSPMANPTIPPSMSPSSNPSHSPSANPTANPSISPSASPSRPPSMSPSLSPSASPTNPPSMSPSSNPSHSPSANPTANPSSSPSASPSKPPSISPSLSPSASPTNPPSISPSSNPSESPSANPTANPSSSPSASPSKPPSVSPSLHPSSSPSVPPSMSPSLNPSRSPSASPTVKWDARIQFNATDGENGDEYGRSVGVSDYTIIVGAPYKDESHQDSGAAYILKKNENSGAWEETQKITASDAVENADFGMNVALSEEVVVVCSVGNGAAYVFEYDDNDDEWVEKDILTTNDGSGYYNTYFNSVAVYGKSIVTGSYESNAVQIFDKNENTGKWVKEQELSETGGYFGYSVGVSGNVIVVGTPSSSAGFGTAYVYEFNNSSGLWEKVDELSPKDNQGVQLFGSSVGVFENIIVIGAPYSNNFIGLAYIFEKNITGSWVEVKRLEAPDDIQYSFFGHSVGVFGDYAVIGCLNGGSAYVFRKDPNGNWDEFPKKLPTDVDRMLSVGISGNAIAIGSAVYNKHGSVFIFE